MLRTAAEVEGLVEKQRALLAAGWPLLNKGGYLLYSTCSLLKAENSHQLARFVAATLDAEVVAIDISGAQHCEVGIQLLPQQNGADGFYYALLRKRP